MIAAQKKLYNVEDQKSVVRTLLYFDIFNYPITAEEIIRFSPSIIDVSIDDVLNELVLRKIIFRFDQYYAIQNNPSLAERRMKGNALAEKRMITARKYSRIISLFPFVEAVMLSGSISKGFMDENSDIDFFIITRKNRLWIVRSSLALFRRIFLFNSHKNFCTNYFIDEDNLEIGDKNIFTAIEFVTLKPMYGQVIIRDFQSANTWPKSILPNAVTENLDKSQKRLLAKKILERISAVFMLNNFNSWLMDKTITYWKRKYGKEMDAKDFEVAFRSTLGISKSHPQFFQKRVLNRLEQKISRYEMEQGIDLSL